AGRRAAPLLRLWLHRPARAETGGLVQTVIQRTEPAGDFRTLAYQVRDAGLLDRRLGHYWTKIVVTVAAFGAGWAALFALGGSWWVLAVAAFLGVASCQLGFLGHDAGHGQVFAARRANRLLGLVIGNGLVGLSFGWWVAKHSAHHAHPNQPDLDPDIGLGLVGTRSPEDAGDGHGLAGWLARWQAELFFPLMLLRSTGLYLSGGLDLLRRRDRAALAESLLVVAHAALYLAVIFWALPPPEAVAFILVHQAVFSVYLGCSFAPNHKGMPIIEDGSAMGFAQRQVVTARNVSGGRCTGFVLGGLNYQIEHHLFPTMPRPNLARAQDLVRAFCRENRLAYCEERPIASYRRAVWRPGVA
ncbi:MAG: fatty acid desaturase family protein, partial [Acidimicrobiales bacterium]